MAQTNSRRQFFIRVSVVITITTVFLTASFIGVLAVLDGEVNAFSTRLPWYLSATALAFVGTIVLLEDQGTSGASIITTALIVSVLVFAIVGLGVEGMFYAVEFTDRVFVSQLVVYFFAAALMGTGFGFWALRHWREFIGR